MNQKLKNLNLSIKKKTYTKIYLKKICDRLNCNRVANNANHLHTRRQEHHLLITITFQKHQYTCGSLVHPPWRCALHLNPLAYLHTLLEPSISLQLTFFIQDSKNLILYSKKNFPRIPKYTCGSPVLPCPDCFHSTSASPKLRHSKISRAL